MAAINNKVPGVENFPNQFLCQCVPCTYYRETVMYGALSLVQSCPTVKKARHQRNCDRKAVC
jgi:hypothetical protein